MDWVTPAWEPGNGTNPNTGAAGRQFTDKHAAHKIDCVNGVT